MTWLVADGKANACLIAFLADRLGVARATISLVSGETSRAKRVRIAGVGSTRAKNGLGGA